jgi:hypothetical protein
MNPRDFLDVADELAGGPGEAHWRTSIGRANYTAFHVARQLFRDVGFAVPRSEQAHAYLRLRLNNSQHPDVIEAGRQLSELRGLRNTADYDVEEPFRDDDLAMATWLAMDVVRVLDDLRVHDVVRARVVQATRDYERDVLGEGPGAPRRPDLTAPLQLVFSELSTSPESSFG